MAKSVLELAVGTGQWDAGLKKAKSALDNFTQANGGLQQALDKESQKMQKFVQMMGGMESTAKTAKGQMNDYKSTIEQLTMQYNRMSEAQKKTIGQDYLQAIEQMKQKYQSVNEEIQEVNRSLNNMKLPDMKDGGLFSGMGDKMSGALQVFAGNMLTKAAGAVANLGSEMMDTVRQGVELAKQGEGIRIAFDRLGRGDILDGLRQATHGTVTDLELMKAAVKFNDFKLPVEELGTMLAFAQQKAKDTGQSVDYMVDSIVTGLGRKSLMILDNLGLSAAEIKEKMAETGDMTKAVGAIIREQMSKAGDYVETAADRAAQANVSLQNKMEELGRKFAPLEEASNNFWTSMKIGILDVIGGPLTNLLNKLTEAGRLMNAYGKIGGNAKVGRMTANLAGASEGNRQSIYQQQQEQFWRYINPREQQIKDIRAWQSGDRNEALQKRIGAITDKYGSLDATKIQAEVDAAKKMLADYQQAAKTILAPVEANISTNDAINNVESLKVKLAELEAQRKKAIAAGDTDLSKNLAKQISQVKSDIKGLGGSTTNKTTTKTPKTEEQLNNEKIQKLTQEYIKATDERRKAIEAEIKGLQQRNEEIKKLTDIAQGKVAPEGSLNALNDELKKLQTERGKLTDPIEIEIQDQQIKEAQDEIDRLNGKKVEVELEVNGLSSFEQLQQNLRIKIAEQNMEVDTNTLQTLMQTAIKNGIDSLNPDFASLQEKMREGMNIPDDTWKALQDQINAKLAEMNINPIKIDFKTGNASQGKTLAPNDVFKDISSGFDKFTSSMEYIGNSIEKMGIEVPEGFKETISALQMIGGILTAISALVSVITTISSVKSVPIIGQFLAGGGMVKHAANGLVVPGTQYSGDNVPIMANAGEVVLNASQQSMLANNLQNGGGGGGGYKPSYISGEQIWIAMNRFTKRTGRGELVTWK